MVIGTAEGPAHPAIYVRAACYTIHRLWTDRAPVVLSWLEGVLHSSWSHPILIETQQLITETQVESTIDLLRSLLMYSPPSSAWSDYLLQPILPPLFALHSAFTATHSDQLRPRSPTAQGKVPQGGQGTLAYAVRELIVGWGKVVEKDMGVRGVWDIVRSKWDEVGEDGQGLFWAIKGDQASLTYGRCASSGV